MTTLKTSSFTCSETFLGGINTVNGSIENERTYRFRVTKNHAGSFDCIPEYYSEEMDKWLTGSPGWNIEEVIDSTGLYMDFGSKRVILPTESVWEEIRQRLKTVTIHYGSE